MITGYDTGLVVVLVVFALGLLALLFYARRKNNEDLLYSALLVFTLVVAGTLVLLHSGNADIQVADSIAPASQMQTVDR